MLPEGAWIFTAPLREVPVAVYVSLLRQRRVSTNI